MLVTLEDVDGAVKGVGEIAPVITQLISSAITLGRVMYR